MCWIQSKELDPVHLEKPGHMLEVLAHPHVVLTSVRENIAKSAQLLLFDKSPPSNFALLKHHESLSSQQRSQASGPGRSALKYL